MKKQFIRKTAMTVMLGVTGVLFTACAGIEKESPITAAAAIKPAEAVYGSLHLSVNPEIEIGYDEKGNVIHVHGLNEEGKRIVSSSTSYQGRPSEAVAKELVKAIYDGGYFKNRFEGQDKNIVFKLEKGSKLPSEHFLDELADEVEDAVRESGLHSETIIVYERDLDQKGMITSQKAREIALAQVGIKEAVFTEDQYDLDDGVYELEFVHNGVEYEYELDARTGKVRKADYEKNDDWDTQDLDDDADDRDDLDDRDEIHDREDQDDRDDVNDRDDVDDRYDLDDRDEVHVRDDLDDRDEIHDRDDLDDADDRYDVDDGRDDADDRHDDQDDHDGADDND